MEPEKVLDEIMYILWTGAPWRSLNAKGASHFQTVHGHFMAWARNSFETFDVSIYFDRDACTYELASICRS
jgi:hypothetical protein